MAIRDAFISELDHEMANTRKTLERVPEDKFSWKPHDKSMSILELVTHLTNLPTWATMTVERDKFDMAPPGEEPERASPASSLSAALEVFDKNVAAARNSIANADDDTLMAPWSLLSGGHELFTMPKATVLRGFFFNHIIHHRAQLGVYLRLNDVPVPATYGPTADESPSQG